MNLFIVCLKKLFCIFFLSFNLKIRISKANYFNCNTVNFGNNEQFFENEMFFKITEKLVNILSGLVDN